jgi:hypothetical protein
MPIKQGQTLTLTYGFDRIEAAIKSYNGQPFRVRDIAKSSGINRSTTQRFVLIRTAEGKIRRLNHGLYQQIAENLRPLKRRLPQGFVTEKVWEVLREAEKAGERPLDLQTMVEHTETKAANPRLSLYGAVANTLSAFYYINAVERFGGLGSFTYQKMQNVSDRPALSSRRKSSSSAPNRQTFNNTEQVKV